MIPGSTAPGCILFQPPPAGGRLAGVVNGNFAFSHGGHIALGGGGDPGESGEHIEHDSFAGQDIPGRARQEGHGLPGVDRVAVLRLWLQLQGHLHFFDHQGDGRQAGQHPCLAGYHRGDSFCVVRYQSHGRPVLPAVQVFADRQADNLPAVVRQQLVPLDLPKIAHRHLVASPYRYG